MAQYNVNNIMVSSDVKDFNRFLDERRRLMAAKIKEYYETLKQKKEINKNASHNDSKSMHKMVLF